MARVTRKTTVEKASVEQRAQREVSKLLTERLPGEPISPELGSSPWTQQAASSRLVRSIQTAPLELPKGPVRTTLEITRKDFRNLPGRFDEIYDKEPELHWPPDYYLEAWNRNIKLSPTELFTELFRDLPGKPEILMEVGNNFVEMQVQAIHGGSTVFKGVRAINFRDGMASHQRLDVSNQGQGTARTLLRNAYGVYQRMGLKGIKIQADEVGGYTWAKFGFAPTREHWKALKVELRRRFDKLGEVPQDAQNQVRAALESSNPNSIWKIADQTVMVEGTPLGKLLLVDSKWDGQLLFDNAQQMQRFEAYIGN